MSREAEGLSAAGGGSALRAALRTRWRRVWELLGAGEPRGVVARLLAAYGGKHRHYHDLRHLAECLDLLDRFVEDCGEVAGGERFDAIDVELAIWFHDAVYETDGRAPDRSNEDRSADWALEVVETVDAARARRVAAMIRATTHRRPPTGASEAVLLDIDLAVLGSDRPRFDAYERDVRAEYAHVEAELYREHRSMILRSFLERRHIYATSWFRGRREAAARENLQRSIDALGA